MANKSKKAPAKDTSSSKTTITRIKASDLSPVVSTDKKTTTKTRSTQKAEKKTSRNIFVAIAGYFKGAWYELRQVRWPNRRATWSLTAAVLIFTGFFVLLVVLLDILFKYLFELILG